MPWLLNSRALRKLRGTVKLDRRTAARRVGVNQCTIHRHEHPLLAPRALKFDTARRYSEVYGVPIEAFARWEDDELAPRLRAVAVAQDPPSVVTLGQRAKHEVSVGACRTVTTPAGQLEVVGNALLKECLTAWALHEGKRYVVEGTVTEMDSLPDPVAHVLGARRGAGARFRLDREAARGLPVCVTVFSREPAHTARLVKHHGNQAHVSVIVRVFAPPVENEWPGFLIFEKKPTLQPWIFVIDDIMTH